MGTGHGVHGDPTVPMGTRQPKACPCPTGGQLGKRPGYTGLMWSWKLKSSDKLSYSCTILTIQTDKSY